MNILILIILFFCLERQFEIIGRKTNAAAYVNANNVNPDRIILYDLQDNDNRFKIILFALVGLLISSMNTVGHGTIWQVSRVVSPVLMFEFIFSAVILLAFAVITIYNVVVYIKASFYLEDIKRMGYIVPYNRADYSYSIDNLVLEGQQKLEDNEPRIDKGAIIEGIICFLVFLICIGYNLHFRVKYKMITDSVVTVTVIMSVLDLFWLISAVIFYRKSDNKKYKNAKQSALGRKNRTSIGGFIAFMIIGCLLTFGIKLVVRDLTVYMFRSSCAHNAQFIDMYRITFNQAFIDGYEITPEKLNELKTGTDVSNWENDCEFTDYVLNALGFDSFDDFGAKLQNVYEGPQIFISLKDTEVEVSVTGISTDEDIKK